MARTTHTTTLNDVDLPAVAELARRCGADPSTAATRWSAEVTWGGGFRSEARIRQFGPIPSDEPTALGGTDSAPNPVEQLLAALGNCLAVGFAANASAAGIEIEDLRIELEGDLDLHAFLGLREGHAGYEGIRATIHLASPAPRAELEELRARVVGSSPVGHTLEAPIPIQTILA